jgi:hypothetical protein
VSPDSRVADLRQCGSRFLDASASAEREPAGRETDDGAFARLTPATA